MFNDSVREELISKITPLAKPIPKPKDIDLPVFFEQRGATQVQEKLKQNRIDSPRKFSNSEVEYQTADLAPKNTSPTLVEFHNRNAPIPEWRLKLKNAVRQRLDDRTVQTGAAVAEPSGVKRAAIVSERLSSTDVNETEAEMAIGEIDNPTLARALKRIEQSRNKFLKPEKTKLRVVGKKAKQNPTNLYKIKEAAAAVPNQFSSGATAARNPVSLRLDEEKLDTNKLPPLPKPAEISTSFDKRPLKFEKSEVDTVVAETVVEAHSDEPIMKSRMLPGFEKIEIRDVDDSVEVMEFADDASEIDEIDVQEIDDCAPFAIRFNAGLFDMIIGSFATLLLLSPFMAFGGEWFTLTGLFGFLATCSVIMFIYMTFAIGYYGRTFGMKLFALEVVDIDGEEYPTVHQAAVSSSVYILSLAFGGIGFLTLLFNDEKRAAHDIVSKTIVVKEF